MLAIILLLFSFPSFGEQICIPKGKGVYAGNEGNIMECHRIKPMKPPEIKIEKQNWNKKPDFKIHYMVKQKFDLMAEFRKAVHDKRWELKRELTQKEITSLYKETEKRHFAYLKKESEREESERRENERRNIITRPAPPEEEGSGTALLLGVIIPAALISLLYGFSY